MTKKVLNKKFGSFFSTKNKGKEVKHQSNKDSLNFYTLLQYSTTLDKICMIIGAICSVLSGLVLPYTMLLFGDVTGAIVSHASKYNDTLSTEEKSSLARELNNDVWTFSVETLGVGFIIIITNYLSTVLFSYSSIRQIFRIRKKFLEKTLSQDIAWFDTNRTGDFATTFTQNISKIEEGIGDRIGTFIFYETSFVSGVVMSLLKGWKLALVCLVSLPLSAVLMAVLSWMSTKFSKREMDAYGAAGAIAEEVFSSIKTVVAFDGQEKEMCRYNKHLLDAKRNNIKKSFFSGLSQGILWFFIYGCYALSFWYGVELILAERHLPHEEQIYTPSNMIGIFCCILIATMNFGMAAPFLETFGSAKGAAQKIFNVLDSESKIKRHINTGRVLDKLSFNVTFDNIYFNYPSRPDVKVLRGFSLKIKIGETVALVGSSGCGKSTTIQLLQRFYDPTEGRIQIDDVDIRDLNQQWLMEKIAVVSQEPALFGVTIAENIRLGKLNATQDEIEEAAKKANAHKFILTLPRGYETVLGEKGAQLSGGQKQRIAIARALVKNPEMLLLDEATSALDTTSEAEVQAALDSISGSCTTIIIAHRLSTIRNATRIIVIDEGAVLEEGTHSQLMDQKGAYYNLVLSQGFTDSAEEQGQKRRFSSFSGEENKLTYEGNDDALKEDIVVDEPKPKGVLWKIMKMTSSDWCYIVLGTISAIITGALLPVYGILYGCIIGVFVYENDDLVRTESNKFCLCFLVLGIIAGSTTFMNIFAFSISGENLTFKIRSKMFECLLGNEIGWYDKKENGVGVICTKLAGDAVSVQGVAGAQIGTTLNFLGTLTLTCAISFYYEWRTTLVLLAVCPIMFFSIYFESTIMRQDGRKNQAMLESSAKLAVEAISNIRTVISLGCEKVFLEQYIKELLPYQSMARKKSHFRGIVFGMGRSFMLFIYIIGIKFGSSLIINGEVDYGAIITVNEVVIVGTMSVGNILSASPNFQKGLAAAARIIGTLERKPCIRNVENPLVSLWDDETVEYSQINFSYPTRPSATILNGLNLTIPKGKTVALVGSSGCGKSTIVQLLERFYDPGYGLLTVNGTDVKQMELRALRSQLGIVSQEPNLFDKTIAENIAYGANYKTVEMDDIIEAAKSANIHNFISNLPLGYETKVGSKGTQLSGGQKQRIAIARALVRNPKILLLDEATSALDNESEKIVQETLDSARQGRTCITIAHRLTTIQDADIICVLDKGVVAEMGTHKQLLDKRGLYYKFYKLQSGHT